MYSYIHLNMYMHTLKGGDGTHEKGGVTDTQTHKHIYTYVYIQINMYMRTHKRGEGPHETGGVTDTQTRKKNIQMYTYV